jgi:hypothetical protein
MKTSESEIEKILRGPQQFTPPAGLKERLVDQIPARVDQAGSMRLIVKPVSGGWLRRWWPALAPAAVSVACAIVFTAQQGKIRELKANIQTLSQTPTVESAQPHDESTVAAQPAEMEQEINRLKELADRLKAEIAQLQQLQTQNVGLRARIAAPPELGLTAEETESLAKAKESLAKAKERALSIACVNNLKQFGLAVRTWALDNNESNPPNILSMSNELSTPKILVCPADTNRPVAADWSSFTMANCSYEFLVPDEKDADREPERVSVRCPIHGNIGLCDGSVQSRVAKEHPDQLVEHDGKLYLERLPTPPAPAAGITEEQMKMYRERYGLPEGATFTKP